jgi:mono/diheme cytochrome c family protein
MEHAQPERTRAAFVSTVLGLLGIALASVAAAPDQTAWERGRVIYEQRCLDCHGPEGRGDGIKALSLSPRPGNLVSAATSAKSDQDLLKIIANGRPRTEMPAWKDELSDEEQRNVLVYIRSLVRFSRSLTPPPPTP